ncbi:MAG: methylmalonyl-CoA carboxyltransferase, partial [Actinomycetota bacterium]|nr:methylmalonyl-CoA carboxyltransferase [Actinomycetota bacterium]
MPVDPNRESWKPGMTWEEAVDEIHYLRGLAAELGGEERVARQHAGGRYTVRERIAKMADPNSFIEMGSLVGNAEYDESGNLTSFTPGG